MRVSRLLRLLFLPVAFIVFVVGWSLYWTGSESKPKKKEKKE